MQRRPLPLLQTIRKQCAGSRRHGLCECLAGKPSAASSDEQAVHRRQREAPTTFRALPSTNTATGF
jgi:hypothetical protein